MITGILADFDHENLDPLLQTYDNITAYVKKHLPNVRSAADMASSVGRALSAVDAGAASLAHSPSTSTKSAKDMCHAELLCAFSVLEHKHKNLQQNQKRASKRGKDQGNGKDTKKLRTPQSNAPVRAEDCTSYYHAHGYQSSHTSALCKVKREGGVLSQRTMLDSSPKATSAPPSPNRGFFDEEHCHGKRTGSPLTTEWTNQSEANHCAHCVSYFIAKQMDPRIRQILSL